MADRGDSRGHDSRDSSTLLAEAGSRLAPGTATRRPIRSHGSRRTQEEIAPVKVILRNPRRDLEVAGPMTVVKLLNHLNIVSESVLVICNDELVTREARLLDTDTVELRPVVSGGM